MTRVDKLVIEKLNPPGFQAYVEFGSILKSLTEQS